MSNNIPVPPKFYELYLDFHEKIFKTHVKCMQHLVAVVPFQKLNQIDMAQRLNHNKSIIDENSFIIEEKEFEYIFDQILPEFKKFSYRKKEELLRLEELSDKRKFSLKELAIDRVLGEKRKFTEISDKYDVSSILLEKVIEFITSPYLELFAEHFNKKISEFGWTQPFCPVCGSFPAMAKVNERKGARLLWCRFCDSTWSFHETVCPFCLNHDLSFNRMIFPLEKKPIRIDACNKCKNYIKTVDESIAHQKYNLIVKYVETYHLDLLAKSYGYIIPNYVQFFLELI